MNRFSVSLQPLLSLSLSPHHSFFFITQSSSPLARICAQIHLKYSSQDIFLQSRSAEKSEWHQLWGYVLSSVIVVLQGAKTVPVTFLVCIVLKRSCLTCKWLDIIRIDNERRRPGELLAAGEQLSHCGERGLSHRVAYQLIATGAQSIRAPSPEGRVL